MDVLAELKRRGTKSPQYGDIAAKAIGPVGEKMLTVTSSVHRLQMFK